MLSSTGRQIGSRMRAATIGLLGFGLGVTMAPVSHAHLAGTIVVGGYVRHVSSFECGNNLGGVPNPLQKPSFFQCTVTSVAVSVLCLNPQNHQVAPGKSGLRTTVVDGNVISPDDITDKVKGIANVNAHFEDTQFVGEDACNRNWTPIEALVTEMEVLQQTFECTNKKDPLDPCKTRVQAYEEKLVCSLPPEFSVVNLPPENYPYTCQLISRKHLK